MSAERSFLGTGWSFPPHFGPGGSDVEMVSGPDDVHQSLQILLTTQLGERAMHSEFGCDLRGVLFEEVSQSLINTLTGLISDAILYHEPRIKLEAIDISESSAHQGKLIIRVDYMIRTTNSRYNMVYPFYINEAAAFGV